MSAPRTTAATALILCLGVVLCRALSLHAFPIYDDAFITWRYAENLAAGRGLVFNPGAPWEPVLGTTTPGYAVLLGALARLGLEVPRASLALNLACDGTIALLLVSLLGRRPLAAAVAVLGFATLPQLARISVGGMEAPLFVALTLGATALGAKGRLAAAGTVAALSCTVRPEGVLLVAALFSAHVRTPGQAARLLLPVAAVGALAGGALWVVYGRPIPQSVLAKADAEKGLSSRAHRAVEILRESFAPMLSMLVLLPVVLVGMARSLRREPASRPFVGFSLLMVAAYLLAGVKTWGWYFYAPLVAWMIGLGLGLESALGEADRAARSLRRALASPAAALALSALAALFVFGWSRRFPDRITPGVYEPMRAWARDARTAERQPEIAASDIGAIGFFTGARILDSEGLVWPEARAFDHQVDVIRAHEPEFALMVVSQRQLEPFLSDPVSRRYRPIRRFEANGEKDLEPELESLEWFWAQDYILFERRAGAGGEGKD